MNEVDIQFLSNQLFEEWKKLGNLSKKAEILSSLNAIQKPNGDPYFHIEYLIDHVLKLTPEEKEENKKYWLKDSAGASATEQTDDMGGGDMGSDMGGDMGSDVGSDSDVDNMSGDVSPENNNNNDSDSAGSDAGGDSEFEF